MSDTLRDELDKEREADEALLRSQQEEPSAPAPEPPTEPAATATTEPAPATAGPEPEPAQDPRQVPLAALQEERERRREMDRQLRETREQMAVLQAKFEAMAAPKPAEPAPEKPDPEPVYADDPAAWLQWQDRQTAKKVAALERDVSAYKTEAERRQQQETQAQQYQQVLGHYAEAARTFAEKTSDWQDAYQHLTRSRVSELVQLGYTQQQAVAQLQQEELQIAVKSLSEGVNPAERLYAVAKMRGYAKATPAPAADPAPAPAIAPKAVDPGIRAAVSKSLSAAPGAPASAPSLAELATMDEDRYMDMVPSTDAFRRLMGG